MAQSCCGASPLSYRSFASALPSAKKEKKIRVEVKLFLKVKGNVVAALPGLDKGPQYGKKWKFLLSPKSKKKSGQTLGKTGYALVGGLKSARELMKAAAKLKAAGFLKPQNLADVIVENEEGMRRLSLRREASLAQEPGQVELVSEGGGGSPMPASIVGKQSLDEEYLAELTTTCKKKAGDFEDRQKLRDEELVAIGEAAKAISEITSSSLVQMKAKQASKSTVLAQLRSEVLSPVQAQVARFLQREATQINSRVLSALAERALADPMGKVKKMIEQLITRLEEQGQAETTKKAWCDSEISTNKQTREEKSDAVSTLQAEMDKLQAELEKLDEDTTGLASELTELEAAVSQATELRAKEKEKNEANLKEAKAGQEAVAKAILVLKEFYAKASKPSLLATSRTSTSRLRDAPEVFGDEAYQGMKNTKSGVISMLEVIEGDFSRLEAETTIGEAAAAKEHETFVEESKLTKVEKSKEAEHKKSRKQEKSSELLSLKADLRGTEKELEAAESYYEKLKPDCLNVNRSVSDRHWPPFSSQTNSVDDFEVRSLINVLKAFMVEDSLLPIFMRNICMQD
ncbi:Uncharacterized protein SCF082_LOCUS888 [Durusdinium trenchii]|uniref:GRIP domain-containing protein n=1 Tax=Durusdinium trenchii TaxID=1381693 RepID=A0ABP0HB26_9DINO